MSEKKGLSRQAYEPVPEGKSYDPYVPPESQVAEFTWKAVASGIFFGICFGWANAYLGLRVGLTISTSIPVAVLTVALFKLLERAGSKTSILEANLSQTIGSASSSVASGVIFTLPALFLWNLDPGLLQMTLLAMCGGLLGVLFMVPLRRFLIVKEHGNLPYPEGTACAEVLVASEIGGARATNVFRGLAVGALFKWLTSGLKGLVGSVTFQVPFIKKAQLGSEVSAALLGVGYILGPRIGGVMVGGGLLSWLIIIPAIAYWGDARAIPLYPETTLTITEMSAPLIWTRYVRYIGAGAVAAGGLITLIRSIPTMVASFKVGAAEIRSRMGGQRVETAPKRTQRELPLQVVGIAVAILAAVLGLVPQVFSHLPSVLHRCVAATLVVIAAFFFVTVSSRIVGLVGVTSNPTSGMTIATLLATSGLFLLLGWGGEVGKAGALTVGCVVAIAASIAGDTSQDLKTGFLLGGTPRNQQIGELVGVITSAAFVCIAVIVIHKTFGLGTEEIPAPQATLMKVVIEGVLDRSLPWGLVGIGVALALVAEAFKIPSLPFAVGVYLPVSTMVPIFLGGLLRSFLEGRAKGDDADLVREQGTLFGSGLVGGEGLLGVGLAVYAYVTQQAPQGVGTTWAGGGAIWLGVAAIGFLMMLFTRYATEASRTQKGRKS